MTADSGAGVVTGGGGIKSRLTLGLLEDSGGRKGGGRQRVPWDCRTLLRFQTDPLRHICRLVSDRHVWGGGAELGQWGWL